VSRVDDDRQADLAAQRAALQRRAEEQRKTERAKADSAFSQLVQKQGSDRAQAHEQKSAVQAMLEEAQAAAGKEEADATANARSADARARARMATGRFDEKVKTQGEQTHGQRVTEETTHERSGEMRGGDEAAAAFTTQGHAADSRAGAAGAAGKGEDRRHGEDSHETRGKDLKGAGAGRAMGQKGDLKADDATGGGAKGGGQNKDGKGGQSEVPAGFRFNPALMAPVPVARPKDMAGSARLRAVANEIAQKIVESARVGTNAAGVAEFQIDLRSNVLKGLTIKVSGSNGKISAVFSGSDRDVLKMLEEQAEGLKQALTGRGLTLAEFKVEER